MTTTLQNRARGVMLGLACGDALGAQVEFMARGTFPPQADMVGGGPHRLQPGEWTDDTAMALHLAEHLQTDQMVYRVRELAGRWVSWYRQGVGSCTGACFDIGNQTRNALGFWGGLGGMDGTYEAAPTARGNGALMRCAPAALAHNGHMTRAYDAAYKQALLTHPVGSADLCGKFCVLLIEAMHSKPDTFRESLCMAYPRIYRRQVADVKSTGYDLDTYEAALWCVMHSNDPRSAIIKAANLGDDADTVAAVTGALAGAVWGAAALHSLSPQWFQVLAWQDRLIAAADALVGT